jgi:hypothetical protein
VNRARIRLLALALIGLTLTGLLPTHAAPRPPRAEAPVTHELDGVEGDDACGLLSDGEILEASGADSVISRTPGPLAVGTAGCHWQLDIPNSFDIPGDLWLDVQPSGFRAMFDLMNSGGEDYLSFVV